MSHVTEPTVNVCVCADADCAAVQMVQLMLELLLTSSGELDPHYSSTLDPSAQQLLSILQQHLSNEANAGLAGALMQWAKASGPPAVRLLRLTCRFYHQCHAAHYNMSPCYVFCESAHMPLAALAS